VNLDIQVAPFLQYPIPHEYVGWHGIEKVHLQSVLGYLQMLLDPDFVVELFFKSLKRASRLVRVLDDQRSLKFISKLSDKFWDEM